MRLELLTPVLLGALALLGALWGGRRALGSIPLSKARRASLERAQPVVEAALAGLYLLLVVPLLFDAPYLPVALALILLALVWFALRDFVAGVFIRAGELCEIGDHVEFGERAGVVRELRGRVLVLADERGAELLVPYSQMSTRALVRTRQRAGAHPHSFELELPAGLEHLDAIARIKQLAMSSHWASLVREPELEPLGGGRVKVRVYALGRELGPAIEAHVRASVGVRRAGP